MSNGPLSEKDPSDEVSEEELKGPIFKIERKVKPVTENSKPTSTLG